LKELKLTLASSSQTNLYLLRAGYGGVIGPLTNIDAKGFASAAFHSFPDRMAFDPYTGDYGPNFVGHALNTATYLTHDDELGWLCFVGNLKNTVPLAPRHSIPSGTVSSLHRWSVADARCRPLQQCGL
jgi:hypothetical protein